MAVHTFQLRLALHDPAQDPETCLAALQAANLDDATVGIGRHGSLSLDFDREAPTAEQAVQSAFTQAMEALPGARLLEASPDLLGLSVLAHFVGCSRQHLHKLSMDRPTFPQPVHAGSVELYHLDELLQWLNVQDAWPLKAASRSDRAALGEGAGQQLFEVAQAIRRLNVTQAWAGLPSRPQPTA